MSPTSRRQLLTAGAGLGAACVCTTAAGRPAQAAAAAPRASTEGVPTRGTHLVMLGTQGGPIPGTRAAASTALVVDGAIYLIDAGSGLPLRFYESRLDFTKVRGLFVTHLHSDHVADAFTFFTVNWTNWDFPRQQVQVHGPGRADATGRAGSAHPGLPDAQDTPLIHPELPTPGIVEFFDLSVRANAYDLNERLRSTRRSNGRPMDLTGGGDSPALMVPRALDVPSHADVENNCPSMRPVEVYEDDRVKVTAVLVDHPPVFPAYAFRFETAHRTIVFSGDTSPNDNLAALAEGADVLVNEVMDLDAGTEQFAGTPLYDTMRTQFTNAHSISADWRSPETGEVKPGVGTVAERCGARSLVLNHVFPGDGSVPEESFRRDVRRTYPKRPVVVSDDLMVLDVDRLAR